MTLLSLDLDDTLVDTDAAAEARVEAAVEKAREVVPTLDRVLARDALVRAIAANPVTQGRIAVFMQAIGVDLASNEGIAIRAAYNGVVMDALEWIDGAQDILGRLRERYRLAVVTNGPAEIQWPKVRKFGIEDLVDHVLVSGDLGVHKPDPAIFAHLLAQAGVKPSNAAHVGDSIHTDIAGARAAGLAAIWYPPRLREHDEVGEHEPHAVIESLAELLE